MENINGPVMLISGGDDQLWPSARLSEVTMERLRAHDHPFTYEHLCYGDAGHMIVVPGTGAERQPDKQLQRGRKHPGK